MNSPQSLMITVLLTAPDLDPSFSIFFTTAKLTPMSASLPNTTCLPSRWGAGIVVMKNWDPFVLGPVIGQTNLNSQVWLVTCVGHWQDSWHIMIQSKLLIFKLVSVYWVSSVAITSLEVSALQHEVGDDSVNLGSLVSEARFSSAELSEVLCGDGNNIIKQFYLNPPHIFTISCHLQIHPRPPLLPWKYLKVQKYFIKSQ